MGPPPRSFAADAHDCIMVRVLGPTEYKAVTRTDPRPKAGSPLTVIPIALSMPSCPELSRYGLASSEHAARLARRPTLTAPARDDVSELRVGTKKRALRSNKETDEGLVCYPAQGEAGTSMLSGIQGLARREGLTPTTSQAEHVSAPERDED